MIEKLDEVTNIRLFNYGLSFFKIDMIAEIADVVSEFLPCSKIVVLASIEDCLTSVIALKNAFISKSITPIIIFLNKIDFTNVDDVSNLFNIPEDVRSILVINKNLFKSAEYVSTHLNLSCFYFVDTEINVDFLSEFAFIKNGDTFDLFKKSKERNIIFNCEFIDSFSIKNAVQYYLARLITLIDLKVKSNIVKSTIDVDFLFHRIEKTIASFSKLKSGKELMLDILNTEIDFALVGKDAILNTITAISLLLLKEQDDFLIEKICYVIVKILRAVRRKEQAAMPQRYADIAKQVSFLGGINCKNCLNIMKEQLEIFSKLSYQDNIELIGFINNTEKHFLNLLDLYKKAGGKVKEILDMEKEKVLLSGYTPVGITIISFFGELLFE